MTITEWQEKFLQLVTEGKYNVFPPAMIKALLAEEADYTKWTEMAEKFFSRYEGLTITISGHNGVEKGLTPSPLAGYRSDSRTCSRRSPDGERRSDQRRR